MGTERVQWRSLGPFAIFSSYKTRRIYTNPTGAIGQNCGSRTSRPRPYLAPPSHSLATGSSIELEARHSIAFLHFLTV